MQMLLDQVQVFVSFLIGSCVKLGQVKLIEIRIGIARPVKTVV
jgi:hypothetical protein